MNNEINQQSVIDFKPNLSHSLQGDGLSHLVEGEIFSLIKKNKSIPTQGSYTGIWRFGSSSDIEFYPFTSGHGNLAFGRSQRTPILDINDFFNLKNTHILNVKSQSLFEVNINYVNVLTSSNGFASFPSTTEIGKSNGNYYFDGQFGQILLFNTVLSDSLRNLVYSQMQSKYAPPVNLGPDKIGVFCDTILQLNSIYKNVEWSDGTSGSTMEITNNGNYWVTVEDYFGNVSSDTISIFFIDEINYPMTPSCPEEEIIWDPQMGDTYLYEWSTGAHTESILIDETGEYFVQITDELGCTYTSDTLFVDLFAKNASIGEDAFLCEGNTLKLLSEAENAASYLWSTGETTPEIILNSSGEYSVIAINENGCEYKDTVQITIIGEAPIVDFDIPSEVYTNLPFEFQENSTVNGSNVTSWNWDFGNNDILTTANGTYTYFEAGNYTITLEVETEAGCLNSSSQDISVIAYPAVELVAPLNNYVGEVTDIQLEWNPHELSDQYVFQVGLDGGFDNVIIEEVSSFQTSYFVSGLLPNAYYWRVRTMDSDWSEAWSFNIVDFVEWPELEFFLDPDSVDIDGDGKIIQWNDLSGNEHHFIQSSYDKRPELINLKEVNNQSVLDFNPVNSNYLIGDDFSHLNEGEIYTLIKKNNEIPLSDYYSGIWKFGSNSEGDFHPYTSGNISNSFGNSSRFALGSSSNYGDITHPHVFNCSSSEDDVFKSYYNSALIFSSSAGQTEFSDVSYLGASYRTAFYYLDGQLGTTILFNTVLEDSLRDIVYDYYRHKYFPPVNLGRDRVNSFCESTLYLNSKYNTVLWSDGSTADSLIVEEDGTYWVTVEDYLGNISSDTIRVQFLQEEIAYPSDIICLEESIEWDPEMGDNYSYLWSTGATTESITIEESGNYYVTLTDYLGCSKTFDTVYVDLFLKNASLGTDADLCSGNTLGLVSGAGEATDYTWSTGATSSEIVLEEGGEYSVLVSNQFGCTFADTVVINLLGSAPVLQLDFPEAACLTYTYPINDESYSQDSAPLNSWTWVVDGDTLSSPLTSLQYDTLGDHEIHYTIGTTAGCFSDTTFTLTVKPLPIVTMQSQGVCQGDEIQFYAGQLTPTLIDTWEWNFGESGSEAYGAEVEYVFSGNGNISITLIGTDIYGCSDTLVQEQTISPKPNAAFYYTDICAGEVVNFANQTTIDYPGQMASRQWNFGDGTTSGQNNPQKPYASYGEYPVSLTVVSADGCSDYAEVLLKVNALPQVNYTYQQACARSSTQFTDASFVPNGSVADVKWSFNGQPPLSGFSVANTFNFPGTVQLKQTVKSAFGCSNAKETYISIGPEIYAELSFSPNAFIVDQPVVFSSEGSGETSYAWDFGNGIVPGSSDTTLTFTEDQIGEEVTVTLWVSNAVGCEDSSSVTRIVSGREVDLAIAEVFEYNSAGYSQLGVRLKNVGQAPIESVELSVHKSGFGTFKETWSGNLSPGTEEIYVFSASPAALTSYSSNFQDYLCISGRVLSAYLEEENLENNELCLNLTEDKELIVVAIPNPIGDELRLRIISETDEVVDVAVFDAMGRKVAFLGEVVVGKGGDEVVVPAGHWAQGVYRVVVGEVRLVVVK